jgi:aminopeptidase
MADPRITKLAQVLVHYSLNLKPGDSLFLSTSPLAHELNLAVYKEATLAGAHIFAQNSIPGAGEIFLKHATDEQLNHISPIYWTLLDSFQAYLEIGASHNTRELSGVDPAKQGAARKARGELFSKLLEKMATGEMSWCYTVYPTDSAAQEADMSLSEYQEFVYGAGLLHLDDPVAAWKEEAARQQKLIDWLAGKDQVVLKGKDIDLSFSIKGRGFLGAAGTENFPDGEIYGSPVESSVNGWVRFGYPALYGGQEVVDIELWFEEGKVVKEKAVKGQELLTKMLDMDEGSRYLGEWGIGTNYGIQRYTKNMLFDEKIGGTIHLAVGAGFPEVGSQNKSGLHWDMLCDMAESEILVDGELFYKDGRFAGAILLTLHLPPAPR